jgi:hypothetical protein
MGKTIWSKLAHWYDKLTGANNLGTGNSYPFWRLSYPFDRHKHHADLTEPEILNIIKSAAGKPLSLKLRYFYTISLLGGFIFIIILISMKVGWPQALGIIFIGIFFIVTVFLAAYNYPYRTPKARSRKK